MNNKYKKLLLENKYTEKLVRIIPGEMYIYRGVVIKWKRDNFWGMTRHGWMFEVFERSAPGQREEWYNRTLKETCRAIDSDIYKESISEFNEYCSELFG